MGMVIRGLSKDAVPTKADGGKRKQ